MPYTGIDGRTNPTAVASTVNRQRGLLAAAVMAAAIGSLGTLFAASDSDGYRTLPTRPQSRAGDPLIRHRVLLGESVEGRKIFGISLGDPDAARKLLVIGAIHGNETAGMAIARKLESSAPPRRTLLWIVCDLNPDGVAAHTRQNADGVDLNRNFPWYWRQLEGPGGPQYSGPRRLSEPESRLARDLIRRMRPRVTIWFHQPLGLVDESGGSVRIERRFAHLVALPLTRLTRYPGSAINWQNQRLPKTTAFAVELPPGKLVPRLLARNVAAVRRLAR